MWICPSCGEHNEDHFQQCWNCVSAMIEEQSPTRPEPPRRLRGLGSIFFRVGVGFVVGTLIGGALMHHHSNSLAEALVIGAIVGVVVGGLVGVFVWVIFPYVPLQHSERTDTLDDEV